MGIFRQFPYSNFHDMNMDQIIKILREMQDEWAATKAEWASYKDFIDNYFDNLDVSAEVLAALRVMASSGELNRIIDPTIIAETTDWLAEHITQPTTPVVDTSLSIAGAAADSKVTGERINEVEDMYNHITEIGKNIFGAKWKNGIQIDANGNEVSSIRNASSGYVPVNPSTIYTASCYGDSLTFSNLYVIFFDSGYNKLNVGAVASHVFTFTTPANCRFIRLMTYQPETTGTGLVPERTQVELGRTATAFEYYRSDIAATSLRNSLAKYEPTAKLYSPYNLINCTLIEASNVNDYKDENILFSADNINISAGSQNTVGIDWNLKSFQAGNALVVEGSRSVGNNFFLRFQAKDSSNTVIKQKLFNDGNNVAFIIPEGTVSVNITMAACWGTALTAGTTVVFNNIKIKYYTVAGAGEDAYFGEPIILDQEPKQVNRCSIDTWINFTNVSAHQMNKSQGMAKYGNYVFVFRSDGGGFVIDYSTKNVISDFNTLPAETHNNTASFTNMFYNENDEFPLIILSKCIGTNNDEALIYRITRVDTTFTFTLINTIKFNIDTYGMSWAADNVNNLLIGSSYTNGNFTVTTDNPIHIWAFKMPALSDIISVTPIVLEITDTLCDSVFDHHVLQGICMYNGLAFMPIQYGSAKTPVIWVIDIQKNKVLNKIILTYPREPEDAFIADDTLYVSQVNSSDTAGTNPLRISTITF